MGARKHLSAEKRKEAKRGQYFAKQMTMTSPRKMRLVADMIRGMEVNLALGSLHFSKNVASVSLEKLLRSAIVNWEMKNNKKIEEETLYVSRIMVDEGITIKRLRPAPQGRGYRIRKRSNIVTIFVDTKTDINSVDNN